MPKVTEAVQSFLRAKRLTHNGSDLLDRWTPFMETQINVASGEGEAVAGKRNTWSDGINEWFNVRIPKNANSTPEFRDYELRFPLDEHAEGIGCTGWDWSARRSRWVGFDFDSITGHAAGVGVSDEELARVRQAAQALPYVEVRKSTGGNGLHLYVYFDDQGVSTANHTEHAALARAILGMMASETQFDFASQIDACGGNLWIWHRKMTADNDGLRLLKPAERCLTDADVPFNWRDHIDVVTRRRAKVRINAVTDESLDPFESLTSARRIVPLDDRHKAMIEALTKSGFSTVWVPDYHLLQTHTRALQSVGESLKLRGFFKTISDGRDPGTPNCFAFPLENGAWKVYRFSQGIPEAETWDQDCEGWTTCYFNRAPDLAIASKAMGGAEMSGNAGYAFDTAAEALRAIEAMGRKLTLPNQLLGRETHLKPNKDGRLVIWVKQRDNEAKPGQAWAAKKSGWWEQVLNIQTGQKKNESSISNAEYDKILRQLVTPVGEDAGWFLRSDEGDWRRFGTEKAKLWLLDLGRTESEVKLILGSAIRNAWKLVNLPFQAEYPGNRQWNLDAAQYRFRPAQLAGDEIPQHPHWDRILKHCGQDLDAAIRESEWSARMNIKTGADYLTAWIACMLRDPFQPLPYLFLHGEQNSGKSILHEAVSLLVTKGVCSADRALTNTNDFNGELANCVLAYIEEKDISVAGASAYNKIKDWVTSPVLWIRKMRTDSYSQANTLHFIQCANKREACPIFPNDTRITMIYVPELQPGEEIAKKMLKAKLEEEAPHFMRTLMDLTLPPLEGRLRLPVVRTGGKEHAEELNRDPLESFLAEHCHESPGHMVEFAEFYKRFQETLAAEDRYVWTKWKVSKSLPPQFPTGAHTGNIHKVGNLSFEPVPIDPDRKPLVRRDGRLKVKEG